MKILLHVDQIERFWSKVNFGPGLGPKGECWEWTAGTKNKEGYGGFYLRQIDNSVNCHKLSFCIVHNFDLNEIPDSIVVRHKCNNPKCVNPKHLELGTYKDNQQDRIRDGTNLPGEENPKSKFTNEFVKSIRDEWDKGELNQYQLAKKFNVTQGCIGKILNNITYHDPDYITKTFHHDRKLNAEDVLEIRRLREEGVSVTEIVQKFGIGTSQFYNIIHRRQWSNI